MKTKKKEYAKAVRPNFPTLPEFKAGIHRAALKVKATKAAMRAAKKEDLIIEEDALL